jgi:hypothetical protein
VNVVFAARGSSKLITCGSSDINAAGRYVGCDKHPDFTRFKARQCTGSGALAFVAVYGGGLDANLVEFFGEPVRAVFGGSEYQNLLPIILFYQVAKQFGFVALLTR